MSEPQLNPYRAPQTLPQEARPEPRKRSGATALRVILCTQLTWIGILAAGSRDIEPFAMLLESGGFVIELSCAFSFLLFPILVAAFVDEYSLPLWKTIAIWSAEAALTVAYWLALLPAIM